ncbi:tetratricopeptide repeat (TPR)-like superfamily protein [Actinidia rufa]|uniref:Tetratricopeptide repeat (TPR)-like superfamily protein n=1 Tax=Actinidia rufa TaxID=165716 RepID=A0A7J0H835_9ERIC|nr:tetratricopeptide repeat (TPR)-like superfamily protein [Actinidia rufa]
MNGTSNVVSKTKNLLTPTAIDQCGSLLHHYATTKSLTSTKKLHAHIITSGLLLSSRRSNHLLSLLTTAYAACGHLSRARKLFDELSEPTLLVYNSMIRVCTLNGFSYDALQLFVELLNLGYPKPDKYTYPFVIKACGDLTLLELGVLVHGGGQEGFDTMRERSEVSWNTMISGYCQNGCAEEALRIYNEMVDAGVEPNSATVVSVLPACGHMNDLKCGKQVHELVEKNSLGSNVSVKNALVDMYVKCGCMNEARLVFDKMEKRDVVTWTTMINGYNLNGDGSRALMLCPSMQMEGVRPNSVTVASLLSACADLNSLKQGRCLHGWALRQNLESDVPVETALIDIWKDAENTRRMIDGIGLRKNPAHSLIEVRNM